MKQFNTMLNIGKAKYVVNHHDGFKTHDDGSPFFDIAIFSNKRKRDAFIRELKAQGYAEKSGSINMKPLEQQLQATIKSLLLSIKDGAPDFSHRAFHIRAFLNYLECECFIGLSSEDDKEDLLACIPRLEQLLSDIPKMKHEINHDCLYKWKFERAKRYLGGLKYKYLPYDTGLNAA